VHVTVDIHERRSGIALELIRFGTDVDERQLAAGDYRLGDIALIERKSVPDLHQSVVEGRFWAQIRKLRHATRWPYLLIEGVSLYDGCRSPESVQGLVLAVSDLEVTVCRSENTNDSARWILRILSRRETAPTRDRPAYAQRPSRREWFSPAEQALGAAPGVSTVTARALLARFGTLLNVLSAEQSELLKIPGIGPRKAAEIAKLARSTSHSGVNRNGQRRAT
jgi:DNA excision repair protein ERCC-4